MNRTQGVNLVTFMPTGWQRLYKHVLLKWVIGQRSLFNAGRRIKGGQRRGSAPPVYLEALNFIHFGRWIILNRHPWRSWRSQGLPHFDGQPPEETKRGIMLFTSNFDFNWRPYVDTFTETATDDLGVFWNSMPGWKYPTKVGYRQFFEFVDQHAIEHDLYYVAFPGFATAHIKSALFVDRAVRSFSTQTAAYSQADWDSAFDRLITRMQRDVGSIPPPPDAVNPPAFSPGGNGHLGLTILAPVRRDRYKAVRRTIRGLQNELDSPLALLPGTHFGRLVAIHKIREHEGYMKLKSGYILLSVDADAPAGGQDAWLRTLYRAWSKYGPDGSRNLIDEIWGSCWGFEPSKGEDGFVSYMTKVSYKATVPFADYPHTSLWDVHRAVTTHGWFTDMVFDATTASERREAFRVGIAANLPVDPSTTAPLPDLRNVQANILHGSNRWGHARYVFLRITDSSRAAAFIDGLRACEFLGNAADQQDAEAEANINVAFTHRGLEIMNATIADTERFRGRHTLRSARESADSQTDLRSAFEGGMYSAEINDVWPARKTPRGHEWEQYGSDATAWWSDDRAKPWEPTRAWPHILVWISATTRTVCSTVYDEIQGAIRDSGGVREVGHQDAKALDGMREHFGFVDGISQPAIKGIRSGKPGDGKLGARGWEGLEVGEFILGYVDESHQPTDRPLPSELARDGTFLVYRKLRQDVKAFRDAACAMADDDDAVAPRSAIRMARKMEQKIMGSKYDGNPLATPPGAPAVPTDPALANDFTYSGDRRGHECPLGSHVRRANPRNDLHFEGRRVNSHRIIRRGMTYGEPYDGDEEGERGLIFIAFNARIEDQFEFIQKQWLNRGTTFRIGDDADPIAGVGTDIRIVINGDTPVLHQVDLPFTEFLGGDYFFVPSFRALEQIADRGREASSRSTPSG